MTQFSAVAPKIKLLSSVDPTPAPSAPPVVTDVSRGYSEVSAAELAYQRGIRLYPTDRREATRAFREAIEQDPEHRKARAYLKALGEL